MTAAAPRLGVALTGAWLSLESVRRLVRHADSRGYETVIVDGDATLLPRRPEAPLYDGSVLSAAALGAAERARIGSIRLPGFWQPLALARSLATLQELSGGRALGFFGVGAQRHEPRLGLPRLSAGERVRRLDELLEAVRGLLGGETVTASGDFYSLDRVSLRPPEQPIPIVVAAAQPGALAVADRHADVWDANVPPLPERVLPLREKLSAGLETWIWIFARPGTALDEAAAAYRRHSPWFRDLSADQVERGLLFGEPQRCRDRLATLREELGVALPILDLAGLDEAGARRALDALAPAKPSGMP